MPHRLLLVEDDAAVRRALAESLAEERIGDESLDVRTATSAEQALAQVAAQAPEVVLADIRMPGMDGTELLKLLRERAPEIDVILMTAFDDMRTVAWAMRDGAFDFLVKPIRLEELRTVLTRAFADRRSRGETPPRHPSVAEAESYRLDALIGRDPRMIDVYKRVGQLAAGRVNALIRGETGTGKELVARAIHYNSPYAAEPFIAVNCTAIPEPLLESELFGHVRGAFTGAVADRKGRFALSGQGTIFLDEVGDTSPEFQAKLLRVLESHEYYPVGAERAERTEARVLAATHRDLEQLMESGRFREDLYYRLRIVEIVLPPLRERPDDIPLLARHFIRRTSRELQRPEPSLAPEALQALLAHHWPGNVRELEHCLTRAVVLATGGVVRPEHLSLVLPQREQQSFPALEAVEREHVVRALAAAEGNRTRAAELLGVSKPRLYRLLAKHGIA
jgi:DNA-binding NtrC family response regulator